MGERRSGTTKIRDMDLGKVVKLKLRKNSPGTLVEPDPLLRSKS